MADFLQIREKYPQYSDMPDADLADRIYGKFYSDMDRGEFDKQIGLSPAARVMPAQRPALLVETNEMRDRIADRRNADNAASAEALKGYTEAYRNLTPADMLPKDKSTLSDHWGAGVTMLEMVIPGISLALSQTGRKGVDDADDTISKAETSAANLETRAAEYEKNGRPDMARIMRQNAAKERELVKTLRRTAEAARKRQPGQDRIAGASVAEIGDLSNKLQGYANNPAAERMMRAETFGEAIDWWARDPWGATLSIVVRSLPVSGPAMAGTILGAAGGRGGAAAGAFAAGFGTEFGIEVAQGITTELQKAGVDPQDTEAVNAWMRENPEITGKVFENASIKAGIIAAGDAAGGALAAHVAGRLKGASRLAQGATTLGTAAGVSAPIAMGAEAAGQFATDGKLKPGEIIAEGIGEVGQTTGSTGTLIAAGEAKDALTKVRTKDVGREMMRQAEGAPMLDRINDILKAEGLRPIGPIITPGEIGTPPTGPVAPVVDPRTPEKAAPAEKSATDTVVDRIIGIESGGNPNAKNPRSSATGLGQFISSTWMDMVKRHRPDLLEGRSRQDVLALRKDPTISREMTRLYTEENAAKLRAAGIDATAGNIYLAHFLGPGGARKALSASDEATVAVVMGADVINANPFLKGWTIGRLKSWAAKKMGGPAPASTASRETAADTGADAATPTDDGPATDVTSEQERVAKEEAAPEQGGTRAQDVPTEAVQAENGYVVRADLPTGPQVFTSQVFPTPEAAQAAAPDLVARHLANTAPAPSPPRARPKRAAPVNLPKYPLMRRIRDVIGPIDPDGPIAAELAMADIVPSRVKNTAMRGFFKRGGVKDLDNLPAAEWQDIAHEIGIDGTYLSRQGVIDAIAREWGGDPIYDGEQRAILAEREANAEAKQAEARTRSEIAKAYPELDAADVRRVLAIIDRDALYGPDMVDDAVERWAIETADEIAETPSRDTQAESIPFEPGPSRGDGARSVGSANIDAEAVPESEKGSGSRQAATSSARTGTKDAGTVDVTPEGDQQVIPGAERSTDREVAEREMAKPKRAKRSQRAPGEDGGLFDQGARNQGALFAKSTTVSLTGGPGAQHQPLWRSVALPPRPTDDTIMIDGDKVKLRPIEDPTRKEGIRIRVQRIIGPRLYQGKIKGKSKLGFYRHKNSEVRIKDFDDVETMAHEMAHWLDIHKPNGGVWTEFRDGKTSPKGAQIVKELSAVSYTTEPKLVRLEGFAEFVRLWLTRHYAVKQIAPEATAEFERILSKNKGLNREMRALRTEMHRWFMQGDLAGAMANQGRDKPSINAFREWLQRKPLKDARAQLVNRWHGARVAERTMHGDIVEARISASKQFQLINGAESTYDAILRFGTPKMNTDGGFTYSGKPLREIFWQVGKKGPRHFRRFMTFLAARRAAELKDQGRENLFTEGQIREALALGVKHPEFVKAAKEYDQFNAQMMDWYVGMNLITPDQKKAFEEANQFYVPFFRIVDRMDGGHGSGGAIGKALRGGDRNINFLEENITRGLYSNVRAALAARASSTLLSQAATNQEGSQFAVPIDTDSRKVRVHRDEMAKKIAQAMAAEGVGIGSNGMIVANAGADTIVDVDDIDAKLDANPDALDVWMHGQPPQTLETGVVSAIVDGERKYFEVKDKAVWDALTGWGGVHASRWLAPLFIARNVVTKTITMGLEFMTGNMFRDTVTGAVLSRNGLAPIIGTLRGIGHNIVRSNVYKEWLLNGGGYGTRIQGATTDSAVRNRVGVLTANPIDLALRALAALEGFASIFENGTRIEEYRRATRVNRKGRAEAAVDSRDVSVDFGNRGTNATVTNIMRTVPFMNAALQGFDRENRALFERKGEQRLVNLVKFDREKALIVGKGMVIAGAGLALWGWNNGDEERRRKYEALTDDERGRYWWLFDVPGVGDIRIPKPYGQIGAVFGTVPETMLDAFVADNGREAGQVLGWTMVHMMVAPDYPAAVTPFLEWQANKNWAGRPIVPERMRGLGKENAYLQFRPTTPEVYKVLGEAAGWSPLKIEHIAKGYLGYLERTTTEIAEAAMWDEKAWGDRPFTRPLYKAPLHHFVPRKVDSRTRWTEGYYKLRTEAMSLAAAVKNLEHAAIRDGGAGLEKAAANRVNQILLSSVNTFRKLDRQLAQIGPAISAITFDPKLTRAEKETRIMRIYDGRNEVLGETYKALQGQIDNAKKELAR